MARKKKKKNAEEEEIQEGKKGKKGGKKKLLMIPIILILMAAIGAAVVLFILPRFGINLLGGEPAGPGEEEPPKNLETFIAGEPITNEDGEEIQDVTISLDTILEEGEGSLIAVRKPDPALQSEGKSPDSSEIDPGVPQYTYIYDVTSPATVVNRYLDAVLGGEEKFVFVDETYLHLEDRPELEDALGALTIARPSVQPGHVFQLVIGWSEASTLTIRASAPEGSIHEPEKEGNGLGLGSEVIETIPITDQIDKLKEMSPTQLGLDGDSMAGYEILPVEGFVKVDDYDCRRFNVYEKKPAGDGYYPDLKAIVMLSADQKHIFRMDPVSNAVTELR